MKEAQMKGVRLEITPCAPLAMKVLAGHSRVLVSAPQAMIASQTGPGPTEQEPHDQPSRGERHHWKPLPLSRWASAAKKETPLNGEPALLLFPHSSADWVEM